MCDFRKAAVFAVVAGLAVTALTALVPNTGVIGEFPDVRFVSIPMLGMSYWGSPLPWLKQVVYPGAPKQPIWPNLLADVVLWIAVAVVLKAFYIKILAKPAAGRPRPKAGRRKPRRRGR